MINSIKNLFGKSFVAPVQELPAVQTKRATSPEPLVAVEDYPIMVGYVAPAYYTGSIRVGAPTGEGRLVLPGGRGVLTGFFHLGPTPAIINAEPARLVYANGDTMQTGRIRNSQGSFSPHSMRSLYRYQDNRLALALLRNDQYEIVPEDPYIAHPFDGLGEKLAMRQKVLDEKRPASRKALSAAENLVAWKPDMQILAALDKIMKFAHSRNLGGEWDAQVNLMQGLLAFFGPADAYVVIDQSAIKFHHVPFEAYDSQLDHVASTMFSATSAVTIKLFDGKFANHRLKPDVTLQFHAERDANMRNSFRFTMVEKARNLQAAYTHDLKSTCGSMPTVAALLDGSFSRGPCHNGQLTAMFEILQERGVLEDVIEHIPDMTGDLNHDISELCLLFKNACSKSIRDAAPGGDKLLDSKIEGLPEFQRAYTAANFTVFLQSTERCRGLSAQDIADAVQWQIEVVGTLN